MEFPLGSCQPPEGDGQPGDPQHGQRGDPHGPARIRRRWCDSRNDRDHEGSIIGEFGLGLEDGEGARRHINRPLGRAELEQTQLRVIVHHILKQALGDVGQIAQAVARCVVAGVVTPKVTLSVYAETVTFESPAARQAHLFEVIDETVVAEIIPLDGWVEQKADVVMDKGVVGKILADIHRPGRVVKVQADPVAAEQVVSRFHTIHIFQADTVAAGAAIVGEDIAAQGQTAAIHKKGTHRVAFNPIILNQVVVTVHEVQTVAAVGDDVVTDDGAVVKPHHHVPPLVDLVANHLGVMAIPGPDAVTSGRHRQIFGADYVVNNPAVIRTSDVYPKEGVFQTVVLNHKPG